MNTDKEDYINGTIGWDRLSKMDLSIFAEEELITINEKRLRKIRKQQHNYSIRSGQMTTARPDYMDTCSWDEWMAQKDFEEFMNEYFDETIPNPTLLKPRPQPVAQAQPAPVVRERDKYLWRAEAVYADGTTKVRHYQSKSAALAWRRQRLEGYPADVPAGFVDVYGEYEERPGIPPAVAVRVFRSEPIVFNEIVVE